MMKTIKINIYKFDELSETAKEKALNDYRNDFDFFWTDEGFESIEKGLDYFDFSIHDYEIDYLDINRCFIKIDNNESQNIENIEYIRLYKYLVNNYLDYKPELLKGNCPFTGYCVDESFLDPIRKFINKPYSINFRELMDECVYSALKDIVSDCEYQYSDEGIIETILANDYDFTEDGKLY